MRAALKYWSKEFIYLKVRTVLYCFLNKILWHYHSNFYFFLFQNVCIYTYIQYLPHTASDLFALLFLLLFDSLWISLHHCSGNLLFHLFYPHPHYLNPTWISFSLPELFLQTHLSLFFSFFHLPAFDFANIFLFPAWLTK